LNLEEKVYRKLMEVPKGRVTTYAELAKAVGIKNGQRVIGRMMNKNPYPLIIPCHRVILSSGKVGGYVWGENVKTNMLSKEGVKIRHGKIQNPKIIYRF